MAITMESLTERYIQRIADLKKQRALFLKIAWPVLVGSAVYFYYSLHQFEKLATPSNLAEMGYDVTVSAMPGVMTAFEDYAVASAPQTVDAAFDFIRREIPVLRITAQKAVDTWLDRDLKAVEDTLEAYITHMLAVENPEVMAMLQSSDPAQRMILAERLKEDILSRFDPEADRKVLQAAEQLKRINAELDVLLSTDPAQLTDDQKLELQALTLWAQVIRGRSVR